MIYIDMLFSQFKMLPLWYDEMLDAKNFSIKSSCQRAKTSDPALISILQMCMLLIRCYWYIEDLSVVNTTTCKRSTENHFCQEYSSFIIYHYAQKTKISWIWNKCIAYSWIKSKPHKKQIWYYKHKNILYQYLR